MNNSAEHNPLVQRSIDASTHTLSLFPELETAEKSGIVYTKPWVVDLVLGLASYCGVSSTEARSLTAGWVQAGDYLLAAERLPDADFVIGNPPYVRLEEIDPVLCAS